MIRPFYSQYCCAKCGKRTDNNRKNNKVVKISTKWLKDYFILTDIDYTFYKFCCRRCYMLLHSKKKDNKLLEEAASDKLKYSNNKNDLKLKKQNNDEFVFLNWSSDRIYNVTGLYAEDFENLFNAIKDNWVHKFDLKNTLAFYFMHMKLGISLSKCSSILPISNIRQIYRHIVILREFLIENFVSKNLGVNHISRGLININHTTTLAKQLFKVNESSIITTWDSTYVYIEKSSNYKFQRQTYSLHKNRWLLKMMMIVTTTGN